MGDCGPFKEQERKAKEKLAKAIAHEKKTKSDCERKAKEAAAKLKKSQKQTAKQKARADRLARELAAARKLIASLKKQLAAAKAKIAQLEKVWQHKRGRLPNKFVSRNNGWPSLRWLTRSVPRLKPRSCSSPSSWRL